MSRIQVLRPGPGELDRLGVAGWEIWTCEPSTFDWHYDDRETCYFLEGRVTVTAEGEAVTFGKGDLVTFPQGLSCTWTVQERVKKHYRFG